MGNETLNSLLWFNTAGMVDLNKRDRESKAAKDSSGKAAANGNLTKQEAQDSASKSAFRKGLYFTSPTGTASGTRGRSRLMGG